MTKRLASILAVLAFVLLACGGNVDLRGDRPNTVDTGEGGGDSTTTASSSSASSSTSSTTTSTGATSGAGGSGGDTASSTTSSSTSSAGGSGEGGSAGGGGDPGTGGSGGEGGATSSTSSGGGEGGGSVACPPEGWVPQQKLQTVLDPGIFPSANVTAGQNALTPFSQYLVTNPTAEDQDLTAGQVTQTDPNGDTADFLQIVLTMDGLVCLSGNQASQDHFSITNAAAQGCTIPAQTTKVVQVWGLLAPVLSSAAANGAWHGVARSGHSDALRLDFVHVASDPECVDQNTIDMGWTPSSMIVRKSQPLITKQPLPTNTLANIIGQEFVQWKVGADGAGPIGFRTMMFSFQKTAGVSITDLHLRRGAADLVNGQEVWLLEMIGGATLSDPNVTYGELLIQLDEQTIPAGGYALYTLHGTVTGAMTGRQVTFASLPNVNTKQAITGSLTSWPGFILHIACGGIDPDPITCGQPYYPLWDSGSNNYFGSNFLWSDLSEIPHDSVGYGSADWTTDLFVNSLGWTETLTAP